MRKLVFTLFGASLLFIGCQESTDIPQDVQTKIDMSDFYAYTDIGSTLDKPTNGKDCSSMEVLNKQLEQDPGLYKRLYDIEYHTRKQLLTGKKPDGVGGGNGGGGGGGTTPPADNLGVINIPVYVHVVYSNSNENISDAQINSQITVMNQDFRKTNSDANGIPSEFAGVAADTEISFSLAGVFRNANSRTSWGTTSAVKTTYPPVTPSTHLNIWVCNIGGGILGYAQFPGGNSATDGIVISPQYFGSTGYVSAPFDKGRTATHEVGHYLNLRHIWGDGRCRQDDFVADTPSSDGPNYGCPSYPTVNCKSNDMTMNYMDYTNDACMFMFSAGQKSRMRAIFASGGPRAAMAGN